MREAIGNSFIVNLLLVFLGVMCIVFVGSISYSKAFKVKNRIIYVIEKYGEWPEHAYDNYVQDEIDMSLRQIGYPLATKIGNCSRYATGSEVEVLYGDDPTDLGYHYCILKYENDKGVYYGVVTFMHFDIPLIGGLLEFPVYGETKSLYGVEAHYHN